ncbi:NAD(P)-binding domain-containing protein [Boudabousia marimammalium]|uniref:Putative oxidoreductase/dehydrogenase Rossmann-like domain-containing protein n=1 Tax=Boudabousia marimammalium TaxID=156892 RepID=A0A1Q5PJ92_9ACTO|nr:NAD(P)-binding domain-containing protein [Boudabousia marimammalium]OKL45922.1 hypothetical protein BM477_07920 [Boudabousia marimammalium]
MKPARLGFGIIGAGAVGCALGSALRATGHALVGVVADSEDSRERAQVRLANVPILSPEQLVERSEAVLLALPANQIAPTVEGLAALELWQPGQLIIHTAPALGTRPLAAATARGALGLAIHPAMRFTGTSLDETLLVDCPFAITAAGPLQPIGMALAVELGGRPFVIAEGERANYAAALLKTMRTLESATDSLVDTMMELSGDSEAAGAVTSRLLDATYVHVRDTKV